MTTLSEILSRTAESNGPGNSEDRRGSAPQHTAENPTEGEVPGASSAPVSEAPPIAPIQSVSQFRSVDETAATADDEQSDEAQSQIDRLIAAHETWLADVQITLPSHVGAQVLNYAIQRSLRTRGLAIDSTSVAEDGPAEIPSATVPEFREHVPDSVPLKSSGEPRISYDESEPELESGMDPSVDPSEVFEGNVELGFIAHSSMGGVAQFLVEVRNNKNLRLLEMKRGGDGGTIISLGLKRPLPLKRLLLEMQNVEQVNEVPSDDGALDGPTFFRVGLRDS